ncbi:MAG: rod shape-determining protein MreC [Sandaracinus sp.]|nr:rod shape-determining protein MreC [Sandaracinus sp.]MCB9623553.1 rod shape-determining protein MreC [Sandaracinus sp.]MCB9631588.1 rod shape-determining protein MreC [Sandaracinus sp.]
MNQLRRFRDAAVAVVLLVLPFFFLSANLKNPAEVGLLDQGLLKISAPLQYVATEAAGALSGLLEEYFYLVEVGRENDRLLDENDRLREDNRLLRVQAGENDRLRDLLELRERLPGESISAEVVTREFSPYFRVMRVRLDRGARDRVRAGMPVVSAQGLVGQIRRTTGRHADVLLTVDQESAIDVVVQRTGARGMLRGTGESNRYLCRIQYLRREDEIEVGDEVYTSGLGRRFPAAILVGRVVRVERQEFGLYQEVEVAPSVSFSDLEEVLVLTTGSREQAGQRRPGATEESEE